MTYRVVSTREIMANPRKSSAPQDYIPSKMNPLCTCGHVHRAHNLHRWSWTSEKLRATGDPFFPISGRCNRTDEDCQCKEFQIAEGMDGDAV